MTFICGPICAGKTFYGKILADNTSAIFLDVSTIVKALLKTEDRSKLQDSKYLDKKIVEKIKTYPKDTVVSGVRQSSILESFDDDNSFIWLEVSRNIRYKRCVCRKDKKDILTWEAFLEAEKKDNLLGLQEVKKFIFKKGCEE